MIFHRINLLRMPFLLSILTLTLNYSRTLSLSLNDEEGFALLRFRERVVRDPFNALSSWNDEDEYSDLCSWFGVECSDGKVVVLNLKNLCLEGTMAPELGKLVHLRALILRNNSFSGTIPREIMQLKELEVLDVGYNNFNGPLPSDLGNNLSLAIFLIDNNKFIGSMPPELYELQILSNYRVDENHVVRASTGSRCDDRRLPRLSYRSGGFAQRKLLVHSHEQEPPKTKRKGSAISPISRTSSSNSSHAHSHEQEHTKTERKDSAKSPISQTSSSHSSHAQSHEQEPAKTEKKGSAKSPISRTPSSHSSHAHSPSRPPSPSPFSLSPASAPSPSRVSAPSPSPEKSQHHVPRPTLVPARPPMAPVHPRNISVPPTPSHSGLDLSQNTTSGQGGSKSTSSNKHVVVIVSAAAGCSLLIIMSVIAVVLCRNSKMVSVKPWATGLSGQLQKAFVSGVPKLKRAELDIACEDFSNIIGSLSDGTVYKGNLSSGVEIAVVSSAVECPDQWSRKLEAQFRKKIAILSKVNHKNFVNLIGLCEEDKPFTRIMVFEYAPNGTLFEHLHIKEAERLDWGMRLRIIMGTAYCLEHMHQLNPPVAHRDLQSASVYLTEDYAAKICDFSFWNKATAAKMVRSPTMDLFETTTSDLETNVFSFGVILLETITGRMPYSVENDSLADWAVEYLRGRYLPAEAIDPTLADFEEEKVQRLFTVIKDCVHPNPVERPKMREVTARLREITEMSPDGATPKLSPLWWAELEILSVEGV